MQFGIKEKRFLFRIAAVLAGLYTMDVTRPIVSFLDNSLGPVSFATIVGALTLLFVWGHFKRWW